MRFLFFEAYVKSEIYEAGTDRIARDVPQIPELIGEIMGGALNVLFTGIFTAAWFRTTWEMKKSGEGFACSGR